MSISNKSDAAIISASVAYDNEFPFVLRMSSKGPTILLKGFFVSDFSGGKKKLAGPHFRYCICVMILLDMHFVVVCIVICTISIKPEFTCYNLFDNLDAIG
jgi:hypothetical protein